MIFKFCSFLPLALALSSLYAVYAISPRLVSGSVDKKPQIKNDMRLNKRDVNARLTFFNDAVDVGTCGASHVNTDFVVALNSQEYGSGEHCFQNIVISALGKSTIAQIVDECPGCPLGGLDLSEGLFEFFAPLSVAVITGSWDFTS